MAKQKIKENSFEAGTAGSSGVVNYSVGYGTPAGGNITQSPSKFSSSEKGTTHFVPNTSSGSATLPTLPDRPDRVGNNQGMNGKDVLSPYGISAQQDGNTPLDPDKQYDTQVDQIFTKKQTPSPDEIMSALQYELGNMVCKDKAIAKQTVLQNLRTDPLFYSRLNMLNIDDDKMKVDESTFSKTKAVLDQMVAAKQKSVAVANTPEISKIFKELADRRFSHRKDVSS